MANRRWTEDDVADLRKRVNAGQSVRDMASEIMRSQEATRARLQMLGLTKPRQFKNIPKQPAELIEQREPATTEQ